MSRARLPRPPPPEFDPFSSSEETDEIDQWDDSLEDPWREEKGQVARRAARRRQLDFPPRGRRKRDVLFPETVHHRFLEDSRELPIQHRHVSLAMAPPVDCDCPEALAKGTLVAIVAVLAFLGFFSTSVLLVVAICLLRLVDRQRKLGKDANTTSLAKRPLPPVPPPRPEHTYLAVKATSRTPDGAYLNASELHPGPRICQESIYQKMGSLPGGYQATKSLPHYQVAQGSPLRNKTTPESEYITVNPALSFSSPPLEKTYSGTSERPLEKNYARAEDAILEKNYGSVDGSKPERLGEASAIAETPVSGRENHIYEEVE